MVSGSAGLSARRRLAVPIGVAHHPSEANIVLWGVAFLGPHWRSRDLHAWAHVSAYRNHTMVVLCACVMSHKHFLGRYLGWRTVPIPRVKVKKASWQPRAKAKAECRAPSARVIASTGCRARVSEFGCCGPRCNADVDQQPRKSATHRSRTPPLSACMNGRTQGALVVI